MKKYTKFVFNLKPDQRISFDSLVNRKVDWESIPKLCKNPSSLSELELHMLVSEAQHEAVDEVIFNEVKNTGSMFVICDGIVEPMFGFIRFTSWLMGGSQWIPVPLTDAEKTAVMGNFDLSDYGVKETFGKYYRVRYFKTKQGLVNWIENGIVTSTEGDERQKFVDMLIQLESGAFIVEMDPVEANDIDWTEDELKELEGDEDEEESSVS